MLRALQNKDDEQTLSLKTMSYFAKHNNSAYILDTIGIL